MSNAAQNWAWQQGGLLSSDKLVLVALADNAWEDGSNAWPSVALLCRKTSLCRRTVQTSLRRLEGSGHIAEQEPADPAHNRPTMYRLSMATPRAESAPPSAVIAPAPAQPLREPRASDAPPPAHLTTDPRAADAPELRTNQLQVQPKEAAPTARTTQTDTQRSKALTDAYAKAEPMCKWPAVNGIVLRAVRSGRFADGEIHAALMRLATEGRGVTIETLRVELAGLPPGRTLNRAEERTRSNVALAERLEAEERQQREIA